MQEVMLLICDSSAIEKGLKTYLETFYKIFTEKQLSSLENSIPTVVLLVTTNALNPVWLQDLHCHFPEAQFIGILNSKELEPLMNIPYFKGIEKPIRMEKLLNVIQNLTSKAYRIGPFIFYPALRTLKGMQGTEEIPLTEKESRILEYLYLLEGQSLSKEELLQGIWHYGPDLTTHTLETHIYRLRKKLESSTGEEILHTTDTGYCLKF
jgi:hypothetical protein